MTGTGTQQQTDIQYFDVGLGTLAFREVPGPSSGPPTLILGGAFANVYSFQLLEKRFRELGPVLLVDMPGTGMAPDAPPHYGDEQTLTALDAFITARRIDRLNILAICAGGPIAHAFASRHPAAVAKLILGNTIVAPDRQRRAGILRACDALDPSDLPGTAQRVLALLMSETTDPRVHRGDATRRLLQRTFLETSPHGIERMALALRGSLSTWPERPQHVQGVECLVYTGRFDPYATVEHCRATARTVEGATFAVLEDCDHMVHVERPRELAELCTTFFKGGAVSALPFVSTSRDELS